MRYLTLAEFSRWSHDPLMLREQGGSGYEKSNDAWLFADDAGFALEHNDGCIVFVKTGRTTYDMHFLFPPTCRGSRGLKAARLMVDEAFKRGATCITGSILLLHTPARWFIRRMGFELMCSDAKHAHYALTR